MKVMTSKEYKWGGDKVNFVDQNNVFVGYDLSQDCCEDAGWFVAAEITPYSYDDTGEKEEFVLDDYHFDKEFMQDVSSSDLDEGGMVVFKMLSEGSPDLYLHIYNSHNGYYSHGFKFKDGDKIIKEDWI